MNTIVMGDMHGHDTWKQILNQEPEFDRVIFIGDYLDSFVVPAEQQLQNLLDIIEFKKTSEKDVVLLLGNHDFHYLPRVHDRCSGYQPEMRDTFEQVFAENNKLFQTVYIDETLKLFSHAGITRSWVARTGITWSSLEDLVEKINELMRTDPSYFAYYDADWSGYGEHVLQGPLWVRPNSLYKDMLTGTQIIGHTPVDGGRINVGKCERSKIWRIDALGGKFSDYLFIDSTGTINVHTLTR
jgi:hypothetical protein